MIPRVNSYIFLHSVYQFVLFKRKLNIFSEVGAPLFKFGVQPLTKTKKTPIKLATKCKKIKNRMIKIMLNYRPNGRRRLGRPLKRLLDEAETSLSRPYS
jgi:hypothetical protein